MHGDATDVPTTTRTNIIALVGLGYLSVLVGFFSLWLSGGQPSLEAATAAYDAIKAVALVERGVPCSLWRQHVLIAPLAPAQRPRSHPSETTTGPIIIAEMIEAFGESNGIPDQEIFRVNLAVDELVTNYVLYSVYKVRNPRIELTLQAGEGKLIVTLLDTGPPFNPLEAPEPDLSDDLDKQKIGGLGLHLVRSYCDRMRHQVVDGYNRVTLEHDLPAGRSRTERNSEERTG